MNVRTIAATACVVLCASASIGQPIDRPPRGEAASQPKKPTASEWKRVESDNGSVYAIDLASVFAGGNSVIAVICALDNRECTPPNMRRVRFDCQGHYMDLDGAKVELIVAPRSPLGRMADMACDRAKAREPSKNTVQPQESPASTAAREQRLSEALRPITMQALACIRSNIGRAYEAGVYGPDEAKSFLTNRCFNSYRAKLHDIQLDGLAEAGFKIMLAQELTPDVWQQAVKIMKEAAPK